MRQDKNEHRNIALFVSHLFLSRARTVITSVAHRHTPPPSTRILLRFGILHPSGVQHAPLRFSHTTRFRFGFTPPQVARCRTNLSGWCVCGCARGLGHIPLAPHPQASSATASRAHTRYTTNRPANSISNASRTKPTQELCV